MKILKFLIIALALIVAGVVGHYWVVVGNAIEAIHGHWWAVGYGIVTVYGTAGLLVNAIEIDISWSKP